MSNQLPNKHTMTESSEQLVTVICLVVQPRYEEVVMTQSEFEEFNKEFQETCQNECEEDLLRKYKFVDWQYGTLGTNLDADSYRFRAYPGDIRSGSDDVVYFDTNQSWQKAYSNKKLSIRKHENYIQYVRERRELTQEE
jgi:hypothetical protein